MAPRKSYLLRIDPQLYADLERWATAELRSVNAQIEFLLSDAVRRAGRRRPPATAGPADGAGNDE
jgi:hypothetical protein